MSPQNREKLMKGIRYLMVAFPFYFLGPALFYWNGTSDLSNGRWIWVVLSVILMLAAIGLTVKALTTVLNAFFEDDKK